MLEKLEMFLNCNEILQRKIKIFTEAFVKYYGEEKRAEIEKQFSKAIYIGYITPDNRGRIVRKLKKEYSDLLVKSILEKTNLQLSQNDLFKNYEFDLLNLLPIYHLDQLNNLYKKGPKGRLKDFIDEGYDFFKRYVKDISKIKYLTIKSVDQLPQGLPNFVRDNLEYYLNKENAEDGYKECFKNTLPLLKKIKPDVTINNLGELFKDKEVQSLLESFREALTQYLLYVKENKDYFLTQEKIEKQEVLLREKNYLLFLKENIDLIPESKREPIYDYLNGKTKNFFPNNYISKLFGTLSGTSIFEYFSGENDKVLDNQTMDWKAQTIKDERIEYFKCIGIDLGDNYDDYANNPECRKKWPSKELVKRVLDSKNKYLNKFNIEFFSSIEEFNEIRKKIDSLDLLDKDDCFNARLLTDSGTFVNPNICLTDEGYDTFSAFVISFNNFDSNALDHNIVHELNHLYELSLYKIDGNNYELTVGWDCAKGTINQEKSRELDTISKDDTKREYELFNEIINELIAQEICEIMHNEHIHVFDDPEKFQYKNTTSYEYYLVLVQEFYKEFKDKIIESRRNNNIQIIFDEVGKENFDELNEIIQIFYDNFSGFEIYSLKNSLIKNEDNEKTRIYKELLSRKDKILENMRNYKQTNQVTL